MSDHYTYLLAAIARGYPPGTFTPHGKLMGILADPLTGRRNWQVMRRDIREAIEQDDLQPMLEWGWLAPAAGPRGGKGWIITEAGVARLRDYEAAAARTLPRLERKKAKERAERERRWQVELAEARVYEK